MAIEHWRDPATTRRIAALELNAIAAAGVPAGVDLGGLRLAGRPTVIHDLNGEVLFHRYALAGKAKHGWADVAASDAFGSPLIAVSLGVPWDPKAIVAAACKSMRSRGKLRTRLVAYSYPKIAVQLLEGKKEIALIEAFTGARVPPAERRDVRETPPGNFERWSLLELIGPQARKTNLRELDKRREGWDEICPPRKWLKLGPRLRIIDAANFEVAFKPVFRTKSRELHYSQLDSDHFPCYEVRGQLTNVWCVAASCEMVLEFYRYEYTQDRIADELGLGTRSSPSGLPYSRDADVVTVLEKLSSNALDATMTSPNWNEFVTEIDANRPMVSFVPGHSRTVAGYTQTRWLVWYTYRGLLVYDPWPPTSGVITRWENFDATTYRRSFTAHVKLA